MQKLASETAARNGQAALDGAPDALTAEQRAADQIAQLHSNHAAAMRTSVPHARRALLLASRLQSMAADLQNETIAPAIKAALSKMIDNAECAAWGYKAPYKLAHERVTRVLESTARNVGREFLDTEKIARYGIGEYYPERVDYLPVDVLKEAIDATAADSGKTDAIAKVCTSLNFQVGSHEAARVSTSQHRNNRYGPTPDARRRKGRKRKP